MNYHQKAIHDPTRLENGEAGSRAKRQLKPKIPSREETIFQQNTIPVSEVFALPDRRRKIGKELIVEAQQRARKSKGPRLSCGPTALTRLKGLKNRIQMVAEAKKKTVKGTKFMHADQTTTKISKKPLPQATFDAVHDPESVSASLPSPNEFMLCVLPSPTHSPEIAEVVLPELKAESVTGGEFNADCNEFVYIEPKTETEV